MTDSNDGGAVVVTWKDPPRLRANHAATATALRQKPGAWGIIAAFPVTTGEKGSSNARALASSINNGRLAPFRPRGAFEATSALEDATVNVYARYKPLEGK